MPNNSTEKRIAGALETIAAGNKSGRRSDTNKKAEEQERNGINLWLHRTFLVGEGRSKDAQAYRRAKPIIAYVGPNGGGKSACAVYDTLPSLRAGRTVLSTVKLLDPATGQPFPSYVPFTDWNQLLDLRDADVIMDEMVGIANSRDAQKLDARVQNLLVQLRRRNIVLRWTAPNWARADKIVREVTQAVVECRGYFPSKINRSSDTGAGVLWAPKRLFNFRTYDTVEFEDWTSGRRDKIPAENSEYMYGPGSEVFAAYDTLDAVTMVAGMTAEGICDVCEGTRRRHACQGHSDDERARILALDAEERAAIDWKAATSRRPRAVVSA